MCTSCKCTECFISGKQNTAYQLCNLIRIMWHGTGNTIVKDLRPFIKIYHGKQFSSKFFCFNSCYHKARWDLITTVFLYGNGNCSCYGIFWWGKHMKFVFTVVFSKVHHVYTLFSILDKYGNDWISCKNPWYQWNVTDIWYSALLLITKTIKNSFR